MTLPSPRRKPRVREVPGVALPLPSALPHPPCDHYEATYLHGRIAVQDLRQAEALWHNGYYGHGLTRGGGGGGGGGQQGKRRKKWRLVEADGLRSGKWFKETREAEAEKWRKDLKGGGKVEVEEDGEKMEEEKEEEEFVEVTKRREGTMMNWEEEEEEEEEGREKMEEEEEEEKTKEEEMEKKTTKQKQAKTRHKNTNTNLEDSVKRDEEEEEEESERDEDEEDEEEEEEERREREETNSPPWRTVLLPPSPYQDLRADEDSGTHTHLVLLPEEAMFLSYALGCLVLTHRTADEGSKKNSKKRGLSEEPDAHEMTIDEMWRAFVRDDAAFPMKYAAYHHFRTQGWVVKGGLKYGVDYVLYAVGPPFFHSQYAVRVCSVWADSLTLDQSVPPHAITWTTVAAAERLASHVNKTPVLCLVLRPRATTDHRLTLIECLKELRVQTLILARWNPSDGSG